MIAQLLKWFFILIPFVYYDFVLDASGSPRLLYLCVSLFLGYLLCFVKQVELKIPRTFSLLYAAYLLLVVLSAFYNRNYIDFTEIVKRLAYFFFFILVYNIERELNKQKLIKGIVAFLWIVIILGIIQYLSVMAVAPKDSLYAITATFSHKNIFSSVLVLAIPFVFMLDKPIRYKIILLVLTLLTLIVLQTRSALLAVIISTVYILFQRIEFVKRRIIPFSIIGCVVLVFGVMLLKQLGTFEYFVNILEVNNSESVRASTIVERLYLWKSSVKMFFDNWLLGVGIGNWAIYFPSYGLTLWRLRQGEVIMQRPHNDIIENFDESGVFGGLLFLTILIYPFFAALKRKNHLFILMGLICFLVISLFSFPQERIVPSLLFFIFVAFSFNGQATILLKRSLSLIIALLLLSSSFLIYAKVSSEQVFKSYLQNQYTQDFQQSISVLKQSKSSLFLVDGTSTPVDWYIGDLYLKLRDIEQAKVNFESALKINPNHIHVLNSLGGCYLYTQEYDSAEYYFNRAIEIAPYYEDGLYNLAHTHFKMGDLNQAIFDLERIYHKDKPKFNERILLYSKLIVEKRIAIANGDNARLKVLENLLYNEEWILSIVRKSYENKILFELQLIDDVTYVL